MMSALGVSFLSGAEKVAPGSAKCSSSSGVLSDAGGGLCLVRLGTHVDDSGIAEALDGALRETSRGGLQKKLKKFRREKPNRKEREKQEICK